MARRKPSKQPVNVRVRDPPSKVPTKCAPPKPILPLEEKKELHPKALENKLPNLSNVKKEPLPLQMEDVVEASEILSKKNNASQVEAVIKDWELTFSNRSALALSFRKSKSSDFLQSSADFDYPALDLLTNLCKKNETLSKSLNKAVVWSVFIIR